MFSHGFHDLFLMNLYVHVFVTTEFVLGTCVCLVVCVCVCIFKSMKSGKIVFPKCIHLETSQSN